MELLPVIALQAHLAVLRLAPVAAGSPIFLASAFGCDFLLHALHPGLRESAPMPAYDVTPDIGLPAANQKS